MYRDYRKEFTTNGLIVLAVADSILIALMCSIIYYFVKIILKNI